MIRSLQEQIRAAGAEIKNIGRAIAQGIITDTTKQMLMDAEQRRADLERELLRQQSIARQGITAEEVSAWLMLFRAQAVNDKELRSMIFRKLVQEVYVFDGPTGKKEDGYIIVWLSLTPSVRLTENLFGRSQAWGASKKAHRITDALSL